MNMKKIIYVLTIVISCVFLFACASNNVKSHSARIKGVSINVPIEARGNITPFWDGESGRVLPGLQGAKGSYILVFLTNCQYRPSPEVVGLNRDGSFTFRNGEYYVKGYGGKVLTTVMGNIPILEVFYIERLD